MGKKYIAKPDGWFDEGTVAELIVDCSAPPECMQGLFRGLRNGDEDEELCPFDEFEEMAQ